MPRRAEYGAEERSDEVAYSAGAALPEDAVVGVLLRRKVHPALLSFGLCLLLRGGDDHEEEAEGEEDCEEDRHRRGPWRGSPVVPSPTASCKTP